jgi:hypothetical protein
MYIRPGGWHFIVLLAPALLPIPAAPNLLSSLVGFQIAAL